MTEQSDGRQDRWLLLIACLLGTAAGLAFYLIHDRSGLVSVDRIALNLSVGFGAAMGLLTLQHRSWRLDVGFALTLAIVVGGLYKFAVEWIGLSESAGFDFYRAFAVSGWALYLVPVAFYQAGREASGLTFPYPQLFLHAWSNKLVVLTAGFFLCCCWLAAWRGRWPGGSS